MKFVTQTTNFRKKRQKSGKKVEKVLDFSLNLW